MGVSPTVRRLAFQRDVRLTNQGEIPGQRQNWRDELVTRYRQQAMAFSEASRMRGSMRESLIAKIPAEEGIDQACSSCDERFHEQKSSAAKYAAQYVSKMYLTVRRSAYDDSDDDDEPLRTSEEENEEDERKEGSGAGDSDYEPSIAPAAEEDDPSKRRYFEDCPGEHGLKIHRTKENGWSCSECKRTFPTHTSLIF